MTDAFTDLTAARARVRGQVQQSRERNAAITVLAERVASTTASVRSARGEVTVTAAADASITDVALAPGALDLRPAALGALITETIARAQRAAAERALTIAEETLGDDSGFVAELRDDVEARFAAERNDGLRP